MYLPILLYFCTRFMEQEAEKSKRNAVLRRLAYMVVAIVAAALLPLKPAFNFQDDKGIIYVRSYTMDQTKFQVVQTEIDSGIATVTGEMSVVGFLFCQKAMLWGCILSLLCFFSYRGRIVLCDIVSVLAGGYYVLMIIYAMRISDLFFATLSPNIFAVILPAVVMQMMVLTRRSTVKTHVEEIDDMEENFRQED